MRERLTSLWHLIRRQEDQRVLALDRHRVDKSAVRVLSGQGLEEASPNLCRHPRKDNVLHVGLERHRETRDVASDVG